MFIDIHAHAFKAHGFPRGTKDAFSTPQELIGRYDKIDVERAVLLPVVNVECSYCTQSNEEILGIAADFPGRFIPFCNIDPRALTNSCWAPLVDILSFYRDKGCKGNWRGLREHVIP